MGKIVKLWWASYVNRILHALFHYSSLCLVFLIWKLDIRKLPSSTLGMIVKRCVVETCNQRREQDMSKNVLVLFCLFLYYIICFTLGSGGVVCIIINYVESVFHYTINTFLIFMHPFRESIVVTVPNDYRCTLIIK